MKIACWMLISYIQTNATFSYCTIMGKNWHSLIQLSGPDHLWQLREFSSEDIANPSSPLHNAYQAHTQLVMSDISQASQVRGPTRLNERDNIAVLQRRICDVSSIHSNWLEMHSKWTKQFKQFQIFQCFWEYLLRYNSLFFTSWLVFFL